MTTSSSSCDSIRWGRRRFARSTRSSRWSARLDRHDDPAALDRLVTLFARRSLKRHDHRFRRGLSTRGLHLRGHGYRFGDDIDVHTAYIDVVAPRRGQAGDDRRLLLGDLLTRLRELPFEIAAVAVPFCPGRQQLRVLPLHRLFRLLRLRRAVDRDGVRLVEVAHLLREFDLFGANLVLLFGQLLQFQLAMLLRADAVDLEILDGSVGARIEIDSRDAGEGRVVTDTRRAEEGRQHLLLNGRRAAGGDDEKGAANAQ